MKTKRQYTPPGYQTTIKNALEVARSLARAGVPLFTCRPALDQEGQWNPAGGSNGTGYLIGKWSDAEADPHVVDTWRPGMALCAVMGHILDALDVDPRHGGDQSQRELQAAGMWPDVIGIASTPSGGTHDFVNTMGVRSMDNFQPGLDIKAGAGGVGRGFVFLAPTVKLSKATGEISAYTWVIEPTLGELSDGDDSGAAIAAMVNTRRQATDTKEDTPHAAFDQMTDLQQRLVADYLAGQVRRIGKKLDDAAQWPVGHRDEYDRGWEKLLADEANYLGKLARADWTPWTLADAKHHLDAVVPKVIDQAVGKDQKWADQHNRQAPQRFPDRLDAEFKSRDWLDNLEEITVEDITQAQPEPANDDLELRRARITWASEIEPEPVTWAWETAPGEGRIPAGSLTIAAGREGTGKSSFGIWKAAHITNGTLPGAYYGTPRRVFYVAVEDSWKHTLVPRLMAAGADLGMIGRFEVVSIDDDELTLSLPHDNGLLERAVNSHQVALVVIDPLMSVIGAKIDTHREREVRSALDPLAKMADRTGSIFLGIAHFNKGGGTDAASLITGSGAFKNVPRSVFGFARDDSEGDGNRVMSQVKNSLGRDDLDSLTYRIESFDVDTRKGIATTGKFVFTGTTDRSVADVLRDSRLDQDTLDEAKDAGGWIESYLKDCPDHSAIDKDVLAAGEASGYKKGTLRNARKGVASTRSTGFGKDKVTTWTLRSSQESRQESQGSHLLEVVIPVNHGVILDDADEMQRRAAVETLCFIHKCELVDGNRCPKCTEVAS